MSTPEASTSSAPAVGPPGAGSVQASAAGAASGSAGAAWWTGMRQQVTQVQQHLWQHTQAVSAQLQTASKSWKPPDLSKGLGMKVDVDFLNPAISGLKQQWQQLPEPVQEVLPYAGVALAASVGVQRLYSEQLSQAQLRYGHLRDDHALLQAQFKQVEAQLAQFQDRRSGAVLELQMAEAVARSTTAAAAAAEAAASAAAAAAAACSVQMPGTNSSSRRPN